MPQFLPLQRYLLPLIWVGLFLLTVLSLLRAFSQTMEPTGAWDLHPYWFYGHFLRAGMNPYEAFAERAALPAGLWYVGGGESAAAPASATNLGQTLANTASYLLALSPLSFFSWGVAKFIWFGCNLVLMAVTPWLALRLLPPSLQLARPLAWLVAFSFYAMKAPRIVLSMGQTSLFIFVLMLISLLARRRYWFWSGLALGIALGKYSLALPVLLFLVYEGRWRVIVVAGAVQLLALAVVTALGDFSLLETVQVSVGLLSYHAVRNGVHLGYLLRDFPVVANGLVVVGTVVVLWLLWQSRQRGWLATDLLPVNSALALWVLLPAYHGSHDTVVVILFLILCLSAATRWQFPPEKARHFGLVWLLGLAMMVLPGDAVTFMMTQEQARVFLRVVEWSMSVAIMVMLGINLWMLPQTPRVDA